MAGVRALPDLVSHLVVNTSGLAKAEAEAKASGSRIGTSMAMVGAAIGVAVVGAVVGISLASLKMAKDFQASTETLVTGAGESQKALESVRQGILALAPAVGVGPEALVKALFMINSAGFHGAEGLKILQSAAEGAKVGNADLGTTANAVTTVMKDYHMAATQAADATNFLVSVVSQGKTHMEDLAFSLAAILPTASALGVPLNQVGGALATLTARGVPAADAATYLRFTLSALAGETPKGKKALESIGLTSLQVGDQLTHQGLLPALQLINDHLTKKFPQAGAAMFATLKDITGGTRGLGAALGLTGQNLATFTDATNLISAQIKGANGQVLGWSNIQQDLNTKLDQFKGKIDAFMISLGNALLPLARSAVEFLSRAFDGLTAALSGNGATKQVETMAGHAGLAKTALGDGPDGMTTAVKGLTDGLKNFLDSPSTKDFEDLWKRVGDAIDRAGKVLGFFKTLLPFDLAAKGVDLAGKISSSTPGSGGVSTPPGGHYTGKASGGPVLPNSIYTVGEKGPETLVMGSQGGTVIPNSGGSGGTTILPIAFVTIPPSRDQVLAMREAIRRADLAQARKLP